ncbi:hypothetical protein [Neisseria iguanae]|uniref:Uncharacterized protein n=1 Tax=Neisseria iguanae TaxID=90242 RepID=A0A2P7TXM0_9NEIS|nr:hypothetical protein [Neisseria iguanae]PSJ79456.1 hypothetical protein C7N83_12060 [Neisseria iguanae]
MSSLLGMELFIKPLLLLTAVTFFVTLMTYGRTYLNLSSFAIATLKDRYMTEQDVVDCCLYTIGCAHADKGMEYRDHAAHLFAAACVQNRFPRIAWPQTDVKQSGLSAT